MAKAGIRRDLKLALTDPVGADNCQAVIDALDPLDPLHKTLRKLL
jgi:hypothetical protein